MPTLSKKRLPVTDSDKRATPRREKPREQTDKTFWKSLGPGLISGAADDDPSGIVTYSIAGAQFGTGLLSTALFTWPLMSAVQAMCARVGMVTGQGLMAALRTKFPRPVLVVVAASLFAANTINIGSDLAGMADAAEMLTHVSSHVWVVAFALAVGWATISLRYAMIANVLKWLALFLAAYVVTAFTLHPNWGEVAKATFIPSVPKSREGWSTMVAILGTTISPYLFFWQASEEVEEEKALGRRRVADRQGASRTEIVHRKVDVGIGTFASNAAMYFIILTTGLTLHIHGITQPQSSREIAEALRPLAGPFAALLYTVGIIGTGVLAIPTLAGSAAYAFAEIFSWRQGIDERPSRAPAFYGVVVASLGAAIAMDFANVNAVRALFWTAVINGVLAPFLLVGVLLVASDKRVMQGQPSSRLGRTVVGITAIAMFGAAAAMFILQ
ncbi:MAG: divalent metal cation transporter [Gemmatimonadaceae bacterium]